MSVEHTHQPLVLEHTFLATQNTLFDAWITPPVVELWLYQDKKKDTEVISHFVKFLSVDRPDKLVLTFSATDHFKAESEVSISFKETPGGTSLTLTQKNADNLNNQKFWKDIFSRLGKLLVQPYLITNASPLTQLAEAVNITVMQIAGFVLPLNDDQINQIPFAKSWTPAQLLRHITKSMSGMGDLLGKEMPVAARDPHEKILPLKQAFLDITHKMQSPEFIVPEEKKYNKQMVLNDLYDCLFKMNNVTDNANQTGLITGLPFGDVTKLELMHFLFYHARRHLIQMKRITDALEN